MKKIIFVSASAFLLMMASCHHGPQTAANSTTTSSATNMSAGFYDFTVKTIDGTDFSFSSLKGKKVLIVNTASECGYTPQYEQLQAIHKQYGGEKFVILGFPCNDFGGQEPGSNSDVKAFCSKNYGVSFQMMDKVGITENTAPIYKWLTSKSLNGVADAKVEWNFWKFLIDENGKLVKSYSSRTKPDDPEIVSWITGK